jgi:hypothetical protein
MSHLIFGGIVLIVFGLVSLHGSRYQRRKREQWATRASEVEQMPFRERTAYVHWMNTAQSAKVGRLLGIGLLGIGATLVAIGIAT